MKDRLHQAALRRQELVARCDAQRAQLRMQLQPLGQTLDTMNTGWRIVRRVGRHPEWLVAGAVGVMLLTPRRLSSMFRAGAQGLRAWRAMAPQLQELVGRFLQR